MNGQERGTTKKEKFSKVLRPFGKIFIYHYNVIECHISIATLLVYSHLNVSEELDMTNTTLDNGRSLRQLIIGVTLFVAFHAIRKS